MQDSDAEIYLKHYIKKLLGRSDPRWPLFQFERSINKKTLARHDEILAWAEEMSAHAQEHEHKELYAASQDPIVRQGWELKRRTEHAFKNKYQGRSDLRILVHVPDGAKSPAGFSLFSNFLEAFEFLGVEVRSLGWNENTAEALTAFKPTVLLTSDHEMFLSRIDWNAVANYRKHSKLFLGLTAGLEEYGNTPLPDRIAWAKKHGVDFYYSYRDKGYIAQKPEYRLFDEAGFKILPLMFGVNIEKYYPVPGIERDLDYIFLGSQNRTKAPRYDTYLRPIVRDYVGFIDGPGWGFVRNFTFNTKRDRYLYARAKVGLNMHLDEQLRYANEVNERTYMLAACGVPQVVDNALLLHKLFSPDALFIARTPEEYFEHFRTAIEQPAVAQTRALKAQREVFERHTTFHRVEAFLRELSEFL